MKLSIVFLLLCVSISLQQQRRPSRLYMYPPARSSYQYYDPRNFIDYFQDPLQQQQQQVDYEIDSDQIQGRAPFRDLTAANGGEGRFFFSALNYASLVSALLTSVSTTTVTSTISSTLTIASVRSCIGAGQFVAGSSSVTCARRRRNAEAIDALEFASESIIEPSSVQPMPMSEAPPAINHFPTAEITSSRDNDDHNNNNQLKTGSKLREKRRFINIFTSILTTLSYSFATSTVAKTYTLVGAANLVCVPIGYTVC